MAATKRAASPTGGARGSARTALRTSTTAMARTTILASRAETTTMAPAMTANATPARIGFTAQPASRCGGGKVRVGGGLQDPERVDWPVAKPCAPDHVVDLDRTEGP